LYLPADDLGGDFYDLIKLNDDEFLIYIADVSGHGIQASLLTIFMRERVRTNMENALTGTGELLSKLVHDFSALDIDFTMYVTLVLCKYKKSKRELSISNAGHNCFPLIIRDNGRTETIPTRGLPICAIADGFNYEEEIVSMNPGDRLILYTDGIVEEVDAATGRAFGPEGVRELAERYHEYNGGYVARRIIDEAAKFSLISAKDDRSIVIADILS
jgi:sigma-B regulation protein RsbU (phosphoserine phosphatase)